MASLQIPSMTYAPLSSFRIILKKQVSYCLCRSFLVTNGDVGRLVDNKHDRSDDIKNTPWQIFHMSRSSYNV